MPSNEISSLAEKIARLIEAETSQPDLSSLAANIEKINRRLDNIESAISEPKSETSNSDPRILDRSSVSGLNSMASPTSDSSSTPPTSNLKFEISNSPVAHPSQARFTVAEAIADAIIGAKSKEKTCTFEPNGRPCDHCGMCSSRGF
jgi:hypothetical protein